MIDGEPFDDGTVLGLTASLLAVKYDNPQPIPLFHEEMWRLCCSDAKYVAIAAPRRHAKSTAITFAYILANLLFKQRSFVLLVSDTESQACEFLGSIRSEISENEDLKQRFGIKKIIKDSETNFIAQFNDGKKFRVIAKGSEQKVRGIKWGNKRPDLIVGDDLENDEIVMSPERREKFRRWFMNALLPCGSDNCLYRIVGTILHLDSMLNRRMTDKTWNTLFYAAEDGNFQNLLWPEKFSEEILRDLYERYVEDGNPEGYSQEYRNQPVDIDNLFFKKDYFYDFERDDDGNSILPNLEYFAAADFAISEKERADYTVIVVGGMSPDGVLHIVDVNRFKGDGSVIVDELLNTQKHWKPNCFTFETAKIDKAIRPFLEVEMRARNIYMNIIPMTPTQSKTMRARSIQGMHKSGSIRYDKEASWWPAFEGELMMVADSGPRGRNDDQFDAFAYLGLTVNQYFEAQSDEEIEEDEDAVLWDDYHAQGRNYVTGY